MTSRRKRGPVTFRPRLSAGLAFSLLSPKRSTNGQVVQSGDNLEGVFKTNLVKQLILAGIPVLMFLSPNAFAGLKVNDSEISKLNKVAVVGYSFYRDSDALFEDASVFKFKREVRVLETEDPEYVVMQNAGDQVLAAIAKGGAFSVVSRADVFENPVYESSTTDPEKKKALNWYFPYEYRVIKLKKANAIALCEALGVDAVVQIHFSYPVRENSSNTLGVFGTSKRFLVMKGQITLIDSNGKSLVSGNIKSEKVKESSGIELGNSESSAGSTGIRTGDTVANVLYPTLLTSYLQRLVKELGYE